MVTKREVSKWSLMRMLKELRMEEDEGLGQEGEVYNTIMNVMQDVEDSSDRRYNGVLDWLLAREDYYYGTWLLLEKERENNPEFVNEAIGKALKANNHRLIKYMIEMRP